MELPKCTLHTQRTQTHTHTTSTHNHHDSGSGRSPIPPSPTLPNVGTLCLLAHCDQTQPSQVPLQSVKVPTHWDVCLEPGRQPQSLSLLSLEVVRCPRCCLDEVAKTWTFSYHLHLFQCECGLPSVGEGA